MVSDHLRVHQIFGGEIEQGKPWPRPICRICREGHVSWGEPITDENKQSLKERNHPGFEPEWISGTVHAIGYCQNDECAQVVIAVGTYRVNESDEPSYDSRYNEYQGLAYSEFYRIEYFSPPLALLPLPEDVPQDVREAIDRASPLLFVDPSFAATALRASVELFLTGQGFPRLSPAGKFTSLDQRIKLWKEATGNHRVANLFLAVKWIGNEGTHEGKSLTVGDVLDGLGFIESAFHDLFVAPGIDMHVDAVNLAKGRHKVHRP